MVHTQGMTEPVAPSARDRAIGVQWRVVGVVTSNGAWQPDASHPLATLFLDPDSSFISSDTVNSQGGTYELTVDGFVMTHGYSSLVGYGDRDPNRTLLVRAMNGLTSSQVTVANADSENEILVASATFQLRLAREPASAS